MSSLKTISIIPMILFLFSACVSNPSTDPVEVGGIGETVNLAECSEEDPPLENYYSADGYCYLALRGEEPRRYDLGSEFGELTLTDASVLYIYYDDRLFIESLDAKFAGEIRLSGSLYRQNEGINTGLYFSPDSEAWEGFPLIYGKHEEDVPRFFLIGAEDEENPSLDPVPDDGTPISAKVTLSDLFMKWNNYASGSPDTADLVSVSYIADSDNE